MPPQPPSFGSREYWEKRFTSNPDPFEWLEAPTALDTYIVEAIKVSSEAQPDLLHIGCGTSLLSYHLRAHFKTPEQIHNIDYSDVAIKIGKQREIAIFDMKHSEQDADVPARPTCHEGQIEKRLSAQERYTMAGEARTHMRWSAANLLSYSSLLDVCEPSAYSLIVDKSTSDSIACADDMYISLPYTLSTSTRDRLPSKLSRSAEPIHPLHILAIHMALLTKPSARWVALSYSEDRYPFLHTRSDTIDARAAISPPGTEADQLPALDTVEAGDFDDELNSESYDNLDDIPRNIIEMGLPDPSTLWRLLGKYEIEAPVREPPKGSSVTHRPKVMHWIYVLERTDVELFIRQPYNTVK